MAGLADRLRARGLEVPEVSVGSTPAMTRVASLEGCTEARPGNYVMIGNGAGEAGGCMVHNPHYDFNDEILPIGTSYWVELVRELLPAPRR